MAYSEDFITSVLIYAKEHGSTVAAKHFKLQHSTINRWNNTRNVYPTQTMRKFSDAEKVEILKYANEHGLTAVLREYDIESSTIYEWNKVFNFYQSTGRRKNATHKKQYTHENDEYKLEVLNFVKTEGMSKAVRKYGVPDSTIRSWNKQFKVYVPRKARAFTDAEKKLIIKLAEEKTVPEAARQSNVSADQIKKWALKIFQKKL